MKVLFLSRWAPLPADNGARIRISNVIRALAQDHEVSLLSFDDRERGTSPDAVAALGQLCSRVQFVPYRGFRPRSRSAVAGFASLKPRALIDTFSAAMQTAVEREVKQYRPDLVVASQLDMVPYTSGNSTPSMLEELELTIYRDAVRSGSARSQVRAQLTWLKLQVYLRSVLPRFRACTVASTAELINIQKAVPSYKHVTVVPNALDLARYSGVHASPAPASLVFSGAMTYFANADAARFLLTDVFPRIRQSAPDAHLRITGATAGVDVRSLGPTSGVTFTGYLDDIRPVVAESAVAVVPLRLGGGTRLKIIEAMALGTPVVSTSKGAEGLDVTHGDNILIADDAQQFASRVLDIITHPDLRARLSASGRRLVEARYDWAVVGSQLRSVVEQAASPRAIAN